MNITQSQGANKQILDIEAAPHLKGKMTTQKIMGIVILSLLPAMGVEIYYFGMGIVWQFILSASTAIVCESMVAILRKRPVLHYLSDLSYLITAEILALTLPPMLPFFYTVAATVFAIIVAKSVFGGLGQNIFNPAMAGFIFIVISCPSVMNNTWIIPAPMAYTQATLDETAKIIFKNKDPIILRNQVEGLNLSENSNDEDNSLALMNFVDTLSGATYLESIKPARKTSTLDKIPGHDFTSSNFRAYLALGIAYTLGGLIMLGFRIIILRMVLAFFIAFSAIQYAMHYLYPGNFMSVSDGLLFGGTMLGGIYIITDPVTNAGTSKGRILFAIFVAFLIVFLRAFGSYSDAVAFAVLLGNAFAPLLDVMASRKPYGFGYKKGGFQ